MNLYILKINIAVNFGGTQYKEAWFNYNRLSRKNGPAITYYNGILVWYKDGRCHRDNEPAHISPCGKKIWYKNGSYIRESS